MLFFETIKIEKQKAFHLEYHEKRIQTALKSIHEIPFFSLKEIIQAPTNTLLRCKVSYNASSVRVEYFEYTPRRIKTLQSLTCKDLDYTYKYTNREKLMHCFNERKEADDILIIQNNYIQDTSIANIAFKINHQWFTPKTPLLYGTTRARLMDEGLLHVRALRLDDISNCEGFALMNAMIGFHQVADGIIL